MSYRARLTEVSMRMAVVLRLPRVPPILGPALGQSGRGQSDTGLKQSPDAPAPDWTGAAPPGSPGATGPTPDSPDAAGPTPGSPDDAGSTPGSPDDAGYTPGSPDDAGSLVTVGAGQSVT
ncbi:ejaculatory bulb-specific protein 1-like [Anguilla anguilla]|uniref:ejaculatory bulb-specific protein 1-like n=1 Tax=Anguilla anguilla TaxID=7936 RepID=UPI0015B185DD|nr:ejaculatory bulb-specific protein 1-like [Anguilla anguilla]